MQMRLRILCVRILTNSRWRQLIRWYTDNCRNLGFVRDFNNPPCEEGNERIGLLLEHPDFPNRYHVLYGKQAKDLREGLLGPGGKWTDQMSVVCFFMDTGNVYELEPNPAAQGGAVQGNVI